MLCAGCWGSSDEQDGSVARANADPNPGANVEDRPIVIGYSNWAGWWPWYIAEKEGYFEKYGLDVEMRWYDNYLESMEAFAAGEIDGNAQTLNDTVSFAPNAVNGEVAVLVNDNSAGDDKIIVTAEIQSMQDLVGKKIGLEEGVVEDFLLTLALLEAGLSRADVEIVNMETGAAAAAFVAGEVDGVGAFPPFWATALERDGSHELISSANYPGAIPDLLVVSQTLIDKRPEDVQKLIEVWFDVLGFMKVDSKRSEALMAERAGVSIDEVQIFEGGVRLFSIKDNLNAFAPGDGMTHLAFAANQMAQFMVGVGLIPAAPADFSTLFDDRFVKAYSDSLAH
ncbi:MAG: ABC transporter substrate-binding protein [Caldilineaceae bacterium]